MRRVSARLLILELFCGSGFGVRKSQWHNCPIEVTSSSKDLVDIALDIIEKGSPLDLELFFAVAWSIWWNRNQAIHEDSGFLQVRPSSIGVVIRDCRGSLIAASSKILPAPFSIEISEALALQEGVLLASELGISHAIVESDALSIIQVITEGDLGGELGHIVQNIKDISSSFS
ncbi:hypothetical protein SO802_015127 [Lithocarpus litseifolius]|uniref:RNase H type-1 domain-containing protein n=1 Tax=Lithocarpus litseifolius TaxID=425828 RepID=A0AAW2CTB6_9ROSI